MRSKLAIGFATVAAVAVPAQAHAGIVVAKHGGTGGRIRVSGHVHRVLIRGTATVRIEGVVLSASPFVVSVEGIPLTITVPAGMTVPAAGQRIEATIMVGTTPNSFTLVALDVEAREVRARGTVASSTATQIVVNAGGAMVTFTAPAGTTLPILATGTFVEARGIMQNGVTTLTRLRTKDD